jgi:predicted ribosomally synthesized peptide with nif11-like leader
MSTTPKSTASLVDRLLQDPEFSEKVAEIQSTDALQDFFRSEGYEFTWAEFATALDSKSKDANSGALSDEALELISGGNFGNLLKEIFVDFPSELGRGIGHGMVNIVKKVAGDIHDAANSGLNAAKNSSSLQNYGSNMSRARNPFAG